MSAPKNPVKSISTASAIIETLNQAGLSTVSTIADELDMPVSTTHNHLSTLVDNGFVTKTGHTYEISYKFLEIGGQQLRNNDFYKVGRAEVHKLAMDINELVNMTVEEQGEGVQIYFATGQNDFVFDSYLGVRYPLHCTAFGKAILSKLPDDRVREIIDTHGLDRMTEHTVTSVTDLFDELKQIRREGYAVDREERLEGLRCVGAPVFSNGELHGAISVSGSASRFRGDQLDHISEEVIRTADMIRMRMLYE